MISKRCKLLKSITSNLYKSYGTDAKLKPVVKLNETVLKDIDDQVFKPRHHPGVVRPKTVVIPETFVNAVITTLADYPVKSIVADSQELVQHLHGRVPPMEKEEVRQITQDVREKVQNKLEKTVTDPLKFKDMFRSKVDYVLKQKIYNWKPLKYDTYNSLVYLVGRSAPEYAALVRIFSEINARDPNFMPRSLFDFGAGVGTVTWAANLYWKKHFFEYFNVDASGEMNDLALILLKGGKGTKHNPLKGVFYRQFLPAANNTYDLVVSAYSLMELPSLKSRLETVLNLWNKTQKYLVIVEKGTNAGFKVVNEVRDFLLKLDSANNHIFSPCPHDETCPRFLLDDGTPCNFEVNYFSMPIGANSTLKKERYSYVIFKKGPREENDSQWPRMVRDTMVRSKHAICRLCTKQGKFEEVIFTASKHGKTTYHCARSTKWGDRLPIDIDTGEILTDENNKV